MKHWSVDASVAVSKFLSFSRIIQLSWQLKLSSFCISRLNIIAVLATKLFILVEPNSSRLDVLFYRYEFRRYKFVGWKACVWLLSGPAVKPVSKPLFLATFGLMHKNVKWGVHHWYTTEPRAWIYISAYVWPHYSPLIGIFSSVITFCL